MILLNVMFKVLVVRENHRNVSKTNEKSRREWDSWDKNKGKLLEDVRWEKDKIDVAERS